MTESQIVPLLRGTPEGLSVRVTDQCVSTNSALKSEAPSLTGDAVLIAKRQTGGRGRLGKSFFSPEGTGLYMSLLLHPRLSVTDVPLITPVAALAVRRALRQVFGVEAGIKWVNDVYLSGRKVCGILTEAVFSPDGGVSHAVLGIGVNVSPPPEGFPEDIAHIAGAVLDKPAPEALSPLAAAVISEFYRLYRELPGLGFSREYAAHLMYVGRYVDVHRGDLTYRAIVTGSDDRCRLLVRRGDGAAEALDGGEITIRPVEGTV